MKHYHLTHAEQAVLETRCKEVSDDHARRNTGRAFFVGQTADRDGQGHALIETDKGNLVRHWGDVDKLLELLDKAMEADA